MEAPLSIYRSGMPARNNQFTKRGAKSPPVQGGLEKWEDATVCSKANLVQPGKGGVVVGVLVNRTEEEVF